MINISITKKIPTKAYALMCLMIFGCSPVTEKYKGGEIGNGISKGGEFEKSSPAEGEPIEGIEMSSR
jgi:hypothetical protein